MAANAEFAFQSVLSRLGFGRAILSSGWMTRDAEPNSDALFWPGKDWRQSARNSEMTALQLEKCVGLAR